MEKYRVDICTNKGRFGSYTGTLAQVTNYITQCRKLGDTITHFGRVS